MDRRSQHFPLQPLFVCQLPHFPGANERHKHQSRGAAGGSGVQQGLHSRSFGSVLGCGRGHMINLHWG